MSDFVLGYGDVSNNCTYTSTDSWSTTLPLSMLNNSLITAIAKTDTDNSITIDITIAASDVTDVSVLGIINHNLTTSGTYRWRCYSDAGRTILVYDSTSISVPTFSTDLIYKTLVNATVSTYSQRYWRLDLVDATLTELTIGKIFLGKRFYPDRNMDYGMQMGVADTSTDIISSPTGVEFYNSYPVKRYVNFGMSLVNYTDSDEQFKMNLKQGLSKPVLFEFNPAEFKEGIYSFVGRMSSLNPLLFPSFNINNFNINITEII